MTFTVRAARPADRPALVGFMAALQEFERRLEPNRAPGPEIADSHLAALEAYAAEHPGGSVLVAETADGLAGFVLTYVTTDIGTYRPPETRTLGWISDLWVDPACRGRGIGRALVGAAEARLRDAGIVQAELAAVVGNAEALALYERLGYRRYEISLAKRL